MSDYISNYTGAQIDAAVSNATKVIPNPVLAGTESSLAGIQIGNTKYQIPSGGGGTSFSTFNINISSGNWTEVSDIVGSHYEYVATISGLASDALVLCKINNGFTNGIITQQSDGSIILKASLEPTDVIGLEGVYFL